jgi:isopentenyl-diphosphate delta-isomerase
VLGAAVDSPDAVVEHLQTVIGQLRVACFCTGSRNLEALRQAVLQAPPA